MKKLVYDATHSSMREVSVPGRVFADMAPGAAAVPDFNSDNIYVLPGFADVHVHLREPGFSYKETIRTGTLAAARGGYTGVCPMPNLAPVPDSPPALEKQLDIIARDAAVRVYPYGAISAGENGRELSDMAALAPRVIAFSDDGRGVQSGELMELAMKEAKSLGKIIAAHCEDMSQPDSRQREWREIERDLELAAKTGCAYHVCHISCKESAALIRQAKRSGVDVSCETAPHYLTLDETMAKDHGRYKMNPPLRAPQDRQALIEALADGTVDMIATDHAPHSPAEKSGGYDKSLNGIVGLETAFPVLYTRLVRTGMISLEKLVELLAVNPRRRFGIPPGAEDYTLFDLGREYEIDSAKFLSMGKSSPFEGDKVYGKCLMTVVGGKTAWQENSTEN